ncbi:MAG: type II toxin-antitoxin system YafQ family toxin [Xanthomonadales bacterium]|nr:type II toxin-antitoxin system YafQ family toxin [Xanthomonadales bacterium]
MRRPAYSGQFKRDVKAVKKRGKDMRKLKQLMAVLLADQALPEACLDHPLKGRWRRFRDAHIAPDWVLIYRIVGDVVHFERTGRLTDLFKE